MIRHPNVLARRLVQLAVLGFFVYVIWGTKHPLGHFVNPAVLFQLDPLVMLLTSLAERTVIAGTGLAVMTLLATFVFGRAFCGWLCPLGAVMDIASSLRSRLGKYRKEKSPERGRAAKYYVLAVLAVLAAFGVQYAWLFDPLTVFVRTFSFTVYPAVNNSVDRAFQFALETTGFFLPLELLYYRLKESVLNVVPLAFPHTAAVTLMFGAILALALLRRRFWCRYLCPLGALLAAAAKFSLLRRNVSSCGDCSLCRAVCRTGAVRDDGSYDREECILCMDCLDRCPGDKTTFSFAPRPSVEALPSSRSLTRRQFLAWISGSAALAGGLTVRSWGSGAPLKRRVLRPPAALPEKEFLDRCVRCGNCMKVCVTNGLQPALFESGPSGMWTPRLEPAIGYCEHKCTLCGRVCPTGAIKPLSVEEKKVVKMGLSEIDRKLCLPWAKGEECLVCEEHCPVADKAIKMTRVRARNGKMLGLPSVDPARCAGCAMCQNKCPVKPVKAIIVKPL